MLSDRRHTRLISEYGGLKTVVPRLTAVFFLITLASIGLPTLNGFIGEFLILLGSFARNWRWASIAATGVILSAVYMTPTGGAAELRVVDDQGKTVRLEGIVHASRYEPSRVMKKGTLHEGCRMTDVEHSASDILRLGCVFQQPAWRARKAVARSGYRVQRRKGLG